MASILLPKALLCYAAAPYITRISSCLSVVCIAAWHISWCTAATRWARWCSKCGQNDSLAMWLAGSAGRALESRQAHGSSGTAAYGDGRQLPTRPLMACKPIGSLPADECSLVAWQRRCPAKQSHATACTCPK